MSKKQIEGRIGQFSDNKIRGWCRIQGIIDSVKVECLLDNQILGDYSADQPRINLAKKEFNSINHGFSIDLNVTPNTIHKIDVRELSSKQSVANSPTLLGEELSKPLIYFIHIPKTAGTSLRFMLDSCFDQEQIFPNMLDIKSNAGLYPDIDDIYELPINRLKGLRLINGHYPLAMTDKWLLNMKLITFFRRPADRVMSHIKHLKKNDTNCRHLTIEEIYVKHKSSLVNLQLRILKNKAYKNAHTVDFQSTKFNESKLISTLDRFAAFGIVEDFERSTQWISEELGLSFKKMILTNQSNIDNAFTEDLKSKIEHDCRLEEAAYEIIKSEFYRRSNHLKN